MATITFKSYLACNLRKPQATEIRVKLSSAKCLFLQFQFHDLEYSGVTYRSNRKPKILIYGFHKLSFYNF